MRNHGKVPKLKWSEHKIEISGLVEKTCQIGMDELAKMPFLNIPVTLACDGNRRKGEYHNHHHTKHASHSHVQLPLSVADVIDLIWK